MNDQNEVAPRPDKDSVAAAMKQLAEAQRVLDYDTKEYTVEFLVYKFADGGDNDDIYVPAYQRRFNWEPQRQSRFIESLLIGLPIPFLFFADMDDGRLEIIDGRQRLSTCKAFLGDELELAGLEKLDRLSGFRYSDLSRAEQRRFRNRTIRSVVLSRKATEEDRRDLFDRINTGSLIPQAVEIRRGAIKGPMTDLIDELVNDKRFRSLCPMTDADTRRRTGEEIVTRFFAFGDGLDGYRDNVRRFLSGWLKDANERAAEDAAIIDEYRRRFDNVMQFVEKYFPFGFAKTKTARTTPRVRFHAISVGTYLAIKERPALLQTGPGINPTTWLSSDDFFTLTTSSAANVRSSILKRTEFVQYMLLGDERKARLQADLDDED